MFSIYTWLFIVKFKTTTTVTPRAFFIDTCPPENLPVLHLADLALSVYDDSYVLNNCQILVGLSVFQLVCDENQRFILLLQFK